MPRKTKRKSKARKSTSRKPTTGKKTLKKKTIRKKTARKKAVKKKATKRKPMKVKAAKRKPAKKKTAMKSVRRSAQVARTPPPMVEPGPPPGSLPPVEEPAASEEAIGVVTHYYSHLGVAVIQINKASLKNGDTIHIKGHSTDFTQQVESMEYEHQHIDEASAGQSVGLKVIDHVREHDIVYLVK